MPLTTDHLKLDPALLQGLKGIEIKSRFLVRGLYHNRHRTSDFGASTEFIEHREYRKGDELRTIDWRVFARTDRFYVKVHEMESNMRVHILLDTSESMRVPPPEGLPGKLDLASTVAGAVAMMVETQQDGVGLMCLGDGIEEHIPPRQGKTHLALLFQHLSNPPGTGGGSFGDLALEANKRLGSRGMVFIVTDALDDPDRLFTALKNMRVREHDVTVLQILDRNEVEFPFDQMTEFRHPESAQKVVGDPAALRAKYLERLHGHVDKVEEYCQKAQADYLLINNEDDLNKLLSLHFIRRLARGKG
ncbi:MAG: DUF58 domain-containing protein [Planctomycetota bacterium]|jgi:uncharacterized protein (DUF58 family)|nr:DUF58 domain-containing protein [Planctomycetota bacterium]MDP7134608.1 DUF58 domain-containing protein [Planctomycetota bacterium]MDP7253293.1 DUF58 domain-containing protein [Planctomycetota bacterium]